MEKFRLLEEEATADIAYEAYGESLEEMYQNAAVALFSVMTDLDRVEKQQTDVFTVQAEDKEALLLDFLNELLYKWDVENVLFSDFACEVKTEKSGYKIVTECEGEGFDPDKHEMKVEIKAVTYFDMEVEEEGGVWTARVTLDI
ncbi:MAG: archease [Candidatus Aenigmatarchaeota archaeon]